jgi:hypothetical protein
MDSYPNGTVGGIQNGGHWFPGNKDLTGMPVLLSDLDDSMILQWKVSQENAWDDGDNMDKWMASINMIFDDGKVDEKPSAKDRDYDLVIELNSHNFNNSTVDVTTGNKRNYFAKDKKGNLLTFNLVVDGKTYKYAVRYKFYYNSGDKNNKVHVKYIPINEDNVPPYLNHSVNAFIKNSWDYIEFTDMPDKERALAYKKVAKSTLYLKSIRAGYEVYKGQSTLRNDFFRIVLP